MTNNQPILRQFIMEYGSILGLSWTAVFAIYVIGFRQQNFPLLAIGGFAGMLTLLAVETILGIRIKVRTVQLELRPTFTLSLLNVLSMFMYACILCGALEYCYFAWLDKGAIVSALNAMFIDSDMKEIYQQMGMQETYKQLEQALGQFGTLSAYEKTFMLFNQNFFTGLILSIPIGLVSHFYKPRTL